MGSSGNLEQTLDRLAAYQDTCIDGLRASIRPNWSSTSVDLSSNRDLQFDRVLGQGGHGKVMLAMQPAVGRHVAVKTLNAKTQHAPQYRQALLSECWVMAALEHPNIPPVHDLLFDDEGNPQVLLKRIEGQEWATLMHDAATVQTRFQEELLSWNLDVLDTICLAIAYAHSKGIVHRDLKPENVMLGAFGEVYVLDWGLAARLDPTPDPRIPFVGDSPQPAGTWAFMAPEALDEDAHAVSERTDVYLAGGMLYEVLTGRPPHDGNNLKELIASILRSEPTFPDDVPRGLRDIVVKAMKKAPEERFASIADLRQALRRYRKRRASDVLVSEGRSRILLLRELSSLPVTEEVSSEMTRIYNECCFAFRQALTPDQKSGEAQKGLNQAAEIMARHALGEGHADEAFTHLRNINAPDPELLADIERVRTESLKQEQRLQDLEQHRDNRRDADKRAWLTALLALLVTLGAIISQNARGGPLDTNATLLAAQTLLLAAFVGLYPLFGLEKTEHNRLAKLIISAGLTAELVVTACAWLAGFSTDQTILMDSAVWVTAAVVATLQMGFMYLPLALVATGCTVMITLYPSLVHWTYPVLCYALLANAAAVHLLGIKPRSRLD